MQRRAVGSGQCISSQACPWLCLPTQNTLRACCSNTPDPSSPHPRPYPTPVFPPFPCPQDYTRTVAIPKELAQRSARLESEAYMVSGPVRAGEAWSQGKEKKTRLRILASAFFMLGSLHLDKHWTLGTQPALSSVVHWQPQAWVEARKASDWSKFAPFLQQVGGCSVGAPLLQLQRFTLRTMLIK